MAPLSYQSQAVSALKGEISVPGDKSISHRAIMLGAIAKGTTTIDGFLDGEDCLATLNAFQQLGVSVEGPFEQRVIVHGVGKRGLISAARPLYLGNSGTSMRLLTGLLAAQSFDSRLEGDESLSKRPMQRVSRPLNKMGADVATRDGFPPIVIKSVQALTGMTYEMPIASAQVKSSLLLAGLYARGQTTIIEPGVTRDHTERMLTSFSYPIKKSGNAVTIDCESELEATDIVVPGDISSAAFFIVAACLIPGSELILRNVGINPTRIGIIKVLELMGADLSIINKRLCGDEPVGDIWVKARELEGVDIPVDWVSLTIDEFPILFVAAACAKGRTVLHGAKELRMKESDRIATMVDGLVALGIDAQSLAEGALINGGKLQGGEVDSLGDHRIAMAFAIAGSLAKAPVVIKNCQNVVTSFPGFVDTARAVGLNLLVKDSQ